MKLTPMQKKIFDLIAFARHPRNQIIAPTQYGKSLTVALAVLIRSLVAGERFIILAPSENKAQIIMSYIIDHCFDNALFLDQLELDPSEKLDRLRRQRSRDYITFKTGGGVRTLTLDARNTKRNIEAAMGFGGNRIILDESSLIDDTLYATVKRMLGGYAYDDQFLLEIGNPFYRNHFYRTWHSPTYNKIFIDYKIGLEEGRYSPEFIEEMRQEAFFDILYECKFPDEDEIDQRGYRTLITMEQIEKAYTETLPKGKKTDWILGVDIGAGGDFNVYVLRNKDIAIIESKNQSNDTMTNVFEVERIIKEYKIDPSNVFIDDTGVGKGVTDRLKEKGIRVNAVSFGQDPQDKTKFKNLKAEIYWAAKQWIEAGGKLFKNPNWIQLHWIKYKISTDKVLQIEPKDELIRRTGKSPDFADAFALTFTPRKPEPKIRFL